MAYTVTSVDRAADEQVDSIWMVAWDGGKQLQLTRGPDSASSPRWNPDGKYLLFLSSRGGKAADTQLWIPDRMREKVIDTAPVHTELSPRELACRITDREGEFLSELSVTTAR